MRPETINIAVGDGRVLMVEAAGDRSGTPILVQSGTPNSRHLYGPWIDDAASKGAYLICYDRPGYGGSTPQPGRSVASCADDVRVIAGELGIDRLRIWGVSGGGPHAAACAALLPDLTPAVALVGSLAPYGAGDLDYFDGMGDSNLEDIQLYFSDPEAARRKGRADWEEMVAATPEQMVEGMKSLLAPVDAAMFGGDFGMWFAESIHDGLSPGDQGWWDDSVAEMVDWGFDLAGVEVPVKVWHGRQDQFVPVQHGEWLAAHIPGAEVEISEDDGHLSMLNRIGEVHDWLLRHS